jgi:hypothetical protein
MGAAGAQADADHMLTPIVTEVSRSFEPVVLDTFIRGSELRESPEQSRRVQPVAVRGASSASIWSYGRSSAA